LNIQLSNIFRAEVFGICPAAGVSISAGKAKIEANSGSIRYCLSGFMSWACVDFCGFGGASFWVCVPVLGPVFRESAEAVLVTICGDSFHSGYSVERGRAKGGFRWGQEMWLSGLECGGKKYFRFL
jgi:hypothetical protein